MRHGGILLAFVVFGLSSPASAATLVVDLSCGDDSTDMQSTIGDSADGDSVLVKPGEYVIAAPINFNRLHNPDDPAGRPVRNIVVNSERGAEVTPIRMSETPADLDQVTAVTLEDGKRHAAESEA